MSNGSKRWYPGKIETINKNEDGVYVCTVVYSDGDTQKDKPITEIKKSGARVNSLDLNIPTTLNLQLSSDMSASSPSGPPPVYEAQPFRKSLTASTDSISNTESVPKTYNDKRRNSDASGSSHSTEEDDYDDDDYDDDEDDDLVITIPSVLATDRKDMKFMSLSCKSL